MSWGVKMGGIRAGGGWGVGGLCVGGAGVGGLVFAFWSGHVTVEHEAAILDNL